VVRYVETVMGTTAGLTLPGEMPEVAAAVYRWLRRVDEVYSPFLPTSQVSGLRDGRLRLADCDPDVRGVIALCEELRERTGGYFDAWAGGALDPCGVVKGWSVETAGELLAERGVAAYSLNCGGDVRVAGQPDGQEWRIGIADPHRSGRVLTVVTGTDLAVATSGVTERGAHVLDPHTGRPATALAAVTVVGPSLTYADAYATAALAMGGEARRWLRDLPGYAGFAVTATGDVWWTPAFRAHAPDLPSLERAG
jgi:FAD:protein FMN transferase